MQTTRNGRFSVRRQTGSSGLRDTNPEPGKNHRTGWTPGRGISCLGPRSPCCWLCCCCCCSCPQTPRLPMGIHCTRACPPAPCKVSQAGLRKPLGWEGRRRNGALGKEDELVTRTWGNPRPSKPTCWRRGLELESGKERRGQMASPRKQRQQALPRGPRVSEAGRCRAACLGDSGLKMDTSTTLPGCQWAMIFL